MASAPIPGELARKQAAETVAEVGIDTVAEAIRSGEFDDELGQVVDALRDRRLSGRIEVLWRIEGFEGLDITEENLTVGEAKLVERATRQSIRDVPVAGSAENIAAVCLAVLMRRRDMTPDEAVAVVDAYTMRDMLRMVSEYVVTSPPKAGFEPETPLN